MRILILGASGLLGQALVKAWGSDEVIPATSKDADIREIEQVRTLLSECRPDWTIHAAAYTDVDGCEKNHALAHEVNCVGAINVARAVRENNSRLLLISTDYVFDGTKSTPYEVDDAVRPLGVYGRTKAAAEKGVRDILPGCCILRTSWLFGPQGTCFPNTILKLAREQKTLKVVSDQRGSPTFNRDLAGVIACLVRAGAYGTIHATNAGNCSWLEFALGIVKAAGLVDVAVEPVTSAEMNRPAPRPRYSVLSGASLHAWGLSLRPWQEAFHDYLREIPTIVSATEPPALSRSGWNHALD
jgi:dTDP-4-dehydrorhamnose reductase